MLKEIYEQPRALVDTLSGRIPKIGDTPTKMPLDEGTLDQRAIQAFSKIAAIGCGTSWHACLIGRHIIERICRIPVEVDLASEYRYRDPIAGPDTLVMVVSQSGETADTLGALREAKEKGAHTLAICNVVDSTIAREADSVLYTHAGPEIGVASTKAFVTQVATFQVLALWMGLLRGESETLLGPLRESLLKLPNHVERALALSRSGAEEIARKYFNEANFLYLGRGLQHPIALEGALKLKEISYIHAEGYPAGEMKHGPIALIDDGLPVVALTPGDRSYEKMCSNIEEVRARGGRVIAVASESDEEIEALASDVLRIPDCDEIATPILAVVPLQLLAYHIAVFKGTDVDQPRNLAKSVTVE